MLLILLAKPLLMLAPGMLEVATGIAFAVLDEIVLVQLLQILFDVLLAWIAVYVDW